MYYKEGWQLSKLDGNKGIYLNNIYSFFILFIYHFILYI